MSIDKLIKYGSVALAGLGLISIAVSIRSTKRAKKAVKNYDEAIDYLAYKTPVVISNDIVKAAADRAADRAANEAIVTVREDIKKEVYNSVSEVRKEIEEEIRKAVTETVENKIDMDELKMAVTNKATARIVDKVLIGFGKYAEPITNGIMKALAAKGGLN
jgi:sugar-specific transcriptional regulator TrmB